MNEVGGILELAGKAGGWGLLVLGFMAVLRGWVILPRERDAIIAYAKAEKETLAAQLLLERTACIERLKADKETATAQLAEAKEQARKWEGIALRGMKIADSQVSVMAAASNTPTPTATSDPRAP